MPAYGHVNYTLSLVQELVRRGQQVLYYLTDEFQDLIEASGASFFAYHIQQSASLSHILQILESLEAEQPDVLIYDYMSGWASILARKLEIPAVSIRATFAMNEHFNWKHISQYTSSSWPATRSHYSPAEVAEVVQQQMEQICRAIHLPVSILPSSDLHLYTSREDLNISFFTRTFQPAMETFDEHYLFVGPAIFQRPSQGTFALDTLDDRPLLYISLGTLFNERPDIFKACIKAFGNTPWQVVLSRGQKNVRYALGPVPANITVANYVPQLEILPRARVFITHAGAVSVMESMYFGVPMVAMPQIPEQALHADRLAELGLGIALHPRTITVDTLREAVERLINDPGLAQRCQAAQQETQAAGGYRAAVDAIMRKYMIHQSLRKVDAYAD